MIKPGDKRLVSKYMASGASAFLSEYVAFIFLYHVSGHILLSNTLSFCCGLIVSYSAQRFWTFYEKDKEYHHTAARQLGFFLILSITNLAISTIGIGLLAAVGLTAALSKVCVMVIVAVWNYLIFKHGIFRKAEQP